MTQGRRIGLIRDPRDCVSDFPGRAQRLDVVTGFIPAVQLSSSTQFASYTKKWSLTRLTVRTSRETILT